MELDYARLGAVSTSAVVEFERQEAFRDYVSQLADATREFSAPTRVVLHDSQVPSLNADSSLYMTGSIDERVESTSAFKRYFGLLDTRPLASLWVNQFRDDSLLHPRIRVLDDAVVAAVNEKLVDLHEQYSSIFTQARVFDARK